MVPDSTRERRRVERRGTTDLWWMRSGIFCSRISSAFRSAAQTDNKKFASAAKTACRHKLGCSAVRDSFFSSVRRSCVDWTNFAIILPPPDVRVHFDCYIPSSWSGLATMAQSGSSLPATKTPLSLIRCIDRTLCTPPQPLPGGRVAAPNVGTRESKLLWGARAGHAAPRFKDTSLKVQGAELAPATTYATSAPEIQLRGPPRRVLIIKKWRDVEARDAATEVGMWLENEYGVSIVVHEDEGEENDTRMHPRWKRWVSAAAPGACAKALPCATAISVSTFGLTTGDGLTEGRIAPPDAILSVGVGVATGGTGTSTEPVVTTDSSSCSDTHSSSPERMLGDDIDLIVTVGGDGTVLHTSAMFECAMPPVVAIAFGSLGFMTAHSLNSCVKLLRRIFDPLPYGMCLAHKPTHTTARDAYPLPLIPLEGSQVEALSCEERAMYEGGPQAINVSLRMRLQVSMYRKGSKPGIDAPTASHVILNELLLERGPRCVALLDLTVRAVRVNVHLCRCRCSVLWGWRDLPEVPRHNTLPLLQTAVMLLPCFA